MYNAVYSSIVYSSTPPTMLIHEIGLTFPDHLQIHSQSALVGLALVRHPRAFYLFYLARPSVTVIPVSLSFEP